MHAVRALLEGVALGRSIDMVADDMGLLDRFHTIVELLGNEVVNKGKPVDF